MGEMGLDQVWRVTFPAELSQMSLYLAQLGQSSGVKTLAAAASWKHSLAGLPLPTDDPLFKTALQGYNWLYTPQYKGRSPIWQQFWNNL